MSDATNKAPSLPWYPRDFTADEPVQLMSLAEEGAYRRLLDHQWLHGSIPGELGQLAAICKNVAVREMRKMWPKIEPCFEKMPGLPPRLRNRKLERVRAEREAFMSQAREAGSLGGKRRWEKERAKQGEDSDPNSDPIREPTQTLVAESYPAVCSLQSASAETTTTTSAGADNSSIPEHTLRSCLGLVVETLYFGNRPPEAAMRNEASIAKVLGEHYGYDRLAKAISGLARRRDKGELGNVGPRQALSLKWLNSKKFDINQLAASEDAFYRSDPEGRRPRHSKVTDISDVLSRVAPRAG